MDKSTPYSPKPLVNATCKLGKKGCFEDGRCHALGDCENKIVTNADKIRAMTDEELLVFLVKHDVEQNRMRLESNGIVPTATQLSALSNTLNAVWRNWLQHPAEGSE